MQCVKLFGSQFKQTKEKKLSQENFKYWHYDFESKLLEIFRCNYDIMVMFKNKHSLSFKERD